MAAVHPLHPTLAVPIGSPINRCRMEGCRAYLVFLFLFPSDHRCRVRLRGRHLCHSFLGGHLVDA